MPISTRKSMVRSTSCASTMSMLLRKIERTNGRSRSCCPGADRFRVTSGSGETVSVCDALLSEGLGSDVLPATVALMVKGPGVSGDGNCTLTVRDWPAGMLPRVQSHVRSTADVAVTTTFVATSGPALCTANPVNHLTPARMTVGEGGAEVSVRSAVAAKRGAAAKRSTAIVFIRMSTLSSGLADFQRTAELRRLRQEALIGSFRLGEA